MSVEIVGDTEIVGEDLLGEDLLGEDLLGANPRSRAIARRPSAPMTAAIANKRAAQGVLVDERGYNESGDLALGFDSGGTIAAGATANVTGTPQRVFKVKRLVVPSLIADSFVINSISVGVEPQLVSTTAVPASVFTQQAVGVSLRGTTAQANQPIVINVTNTSGAPVQFRAAIVGPAVY